MTACIDAKVAQGLTQYADVYFDELVPECFTSAYALQADPKATKEEIKAAFSAGDACADAKLKAIG